MRKSSQSEYSASFLLTCIQVNNLHPSTCYLLLIWDQVTVDTRKMKVSHRANLELARILKHRVFVLSLMEKS